MRNVGKGRGRAGAGTARPRTAAWLSVRKCKIPGNLAARVVEPFKKGDGIRRARRTIGRGSGERLAWSDEDARAHVTSKFLG